MDRSEFAQVEFELVLPERLLVLMIGLPGAGKTTWLAEHSFPSLSTDALREWLFGDAGDQRSPALVFSLMRKILGIRLASGATRTYIDATNLTSATRKPWLKIADESGVPVWAVWLDTEVSLCLERCQARERRVDATVIRKMARELRPPRAGAEGIARLYHIRHGKGEWVY